MKNLQTFEEFLNEQLLNEKAYQFTGFNGAKGIPGKVQFAFKKIIEHIKLDEDSTKTLVEINKIWQKWADKEGAEIIKDEVLKVIKDESLIYFIIATLSNVEFKIEHEESESRNGPASITIKIPSDFVINVCLHESGKDAGRFSKKLGGMVNSPLMSKSFTSIMGNGKYDESLQNNIEIRSVFQLGVDTK